MAKKIKLFVCTQGKHCKKRGSKEVLCALAEQLESFGLKDRVCLKKSGCLGQCGRGPAVQVEPLDCIYGVAKERHCKDLIRSLKKRRKPPKKLLLDS